MNSALLGRQADLFQLGSKRSSVAKVAKTLGSVLAILPISWRDRLPDVAEVAKTLEIVPAMRPISGEIGYLLEKPLLLP